MTKRSFSLQRVFRLGARGSQAGISVVETLIMVPFIALLFGAVIHLTLVAQAKSNLEYAALMAARIASTTPEFGFGSNLMRDEVMKRMQASDANNVAYQATCGRNLVEIRVLRPSNDAFLDFGQADIVPGANVIPNDNLAARSQQIGGASGITIQDANILHIRVFYLFDSKVPFMRLDIWPNEDRELSGHEESCDNPMMTGGIWISADAVVVMQTPAILNSVTDSYIVGTAAYISPPY